MLGENAIDSTVIVEQVLINTVVGKIRFLFSQKPGMYLQISIPSFFYNLFFGIEENDSKNTYSM